MDIKDESQRIEHILKSDNTTDHSAFHAELHKIQDLDSNHGTLNVDQYHNDIAAIEKQLQTDGYLPQFKLLLKPEDKAGDVNSEGSQTAPHPGFHPGFHPQTGAPGEEKSGEQKSGEQKSGQQKSGEQKSGEKKSTTDKPLEAGSAKIEATGGKLYELNHLDHSAGDHKTPDAMVLLPKDFDPSKPIHVVVYDHGWADTAKGAYNKEHLAEQMAKAPPNTVLIVPEWQKNPGGSGAWGDDQGEFSKPNFVSGMMQEIFDKTPELQGKTLADVDHIGIISHSAGYNAAESELYNNGEFSKKINSVTLLDSLYDANGFDKWLHDNINDLANGTKHFQNIFNSYTATNSTALAERVRQYLKDAGLPPDSLDSDYTHDATPAKPGRFHKHPIVFKSTSEQHEELPQKYVSMVQAAANGDDTVM